MAEPIYPIERNLTNHPPTAETQQVMEDIRVVAKLLATAIDEGCPQSREKSLAFTNLEQALMWSMASLARSDFDAVTEPRG